MLKRILSLACCLSLTVGLFTYRPPEAKAIVTEASLATSVLWSFMQSAGITFNGTGMNSSSWAEAIEPYLRDFTEWKDSAAKSFWHWLGYDGASEFIKALSWSQITHPITMPFPSVVIPPAVAKKMGEFTHWFAEKVGLASGGESKLVASSRGSYTLPLRDGGTFIVADDSNWKQSTVFEIPFDSKECSYFFPSGQLFLTRKSESDVFYKLTSDNGGITYPGASYGARYARLIGVFFTSSVSGSGSPVFNSYFLKESTDSGDSFGTRSKYLSHEFSFDEFRTLFTSDISLTGDFSASAVQPGALSPTYDDKGEKPTVVAYPNINGDLTSINDLLQQILDKLATNDLNSSASLEGEAAPDVPATDIGWKGTIEKIYQGIIDLPGRIAEAIKDLFIPHEGYAAEFVSGLTGAYQGRFGLLTYPFSVLGDFVGTVATLDEQEPILRWNDVKWQDHVVITKGEYNLKSAIAGTEMQAVYQVYRTVASAALIVGFLHLCIRKLREVQSH